MKKPPKFMQGASKSTGKSLEIKAFLANNYKNIPTLSNSSLSYNSSHPTYINIEIYLRFKILQFSPK